MHEALGRSQIEVRQEDREKPLLHASCDWVWLTNKRRKRGENPKLQAKFVGPYQVLKAWGTTHIWWNSRASCPSRVKKG